MTDFQSGVEPMVYSGRIRMPYQWSAGETGSRFFTQLRDYGRIWGSRCRVCDLVFVPPRKVCGRCLNGIGEWIELPPAGVLQTFTVVYRHRPAIHPADPPFAYGIIRLDGADSGLIHLLGEIEPGEIVSGLRVQAVLKEKRERRGDILDIKYFKPFSA
ncbi:MAG: Zn-ribbon domain-containing OB-fold protein [Peptococcaceae bacterium]|jgi:uncharacterized OB-fold protein|nr:Zn-ribbon domain-containing OB-fold protein [Peptococcaceae bacterium]